MNNIDFINKYGKREFIDMCKYIPMELSLAKAQRQIGGFKINNSKKRVKFYRKNKDSIYLDFATIFDLGCNNIQKYINEEEKVK